VTTHEAPRPLTPAEQLATDAYVAELVAAAPPPTPELVARLRHVFAEPRGEASRPATASDKAPAGRRRPA